MGWALVQRYAGWEASTEAGGPSGDPLLVIVLEGLRNGCSWVVVVAELEPA
jgi:hypothetical protein